MTNRPVCAGWAPGAMLFGATLAGMLGGCATARSADRGPPAGSEASGAAEEGRRKGEEPATSAPEADVPPGGGGRDRAGAGGAPDGRGFGLTREAAVNVCEPAGEHRYLRSLRCPDGSKTAFERRGSVGSRTDAEVSDLELLMDAHRKLPPGTPDGHIIDLYDVRCEGEPDLEVYMDMYHCADPDPVRPVGPLRP